MIINHAVKLGMLSDFAHNVVKIGGASKAPPPTSRKPQLPDKLKLAQYAERELATSRAGPLVFRDLRTKERIVSGHMPAN